jgi:predicted metal-dependent hydrolase
MSSQLRQVRDIHYQLLPGAQRQTTDIVIERNGLITVRPPAHMTPEQVDQTVYAKRMWIYRNLAEWRDLNATRVVREWVNGESFLYLGSSYRLSLVDEQDEPLKLKEGRFCLLRSVIETGGQAAALRAFETFYATKGQSRVEARVAHFAARVGVVPGKVRIKDLGYRWASCLAKGGIHFHWKCLMAPQTVIDYIVVHELCHMRHRDHSDSFWNEVDKILPDWQERREWLRVRGAGLDI